MDNLLDITPSAGYYTIAQLPTESSSQNIIVSTNPDANQSYKKGKIVAVGDREKTAQGGTIEPQYQVGDVVWYSLSSIKFEEITEDGKSIQLIRFSSVVAKINNE